MKEKKREEKPIMRPLMIPLSHTTILSLLLFISPIAEASILEETCKRVTAARPNIGYEFCVTSLRTDPGSSSADLHGLAVIATRLSLADATKMESRIDQLMVVKSKPFLKDCLSVCSEVYSEAIDHLNDAIRNLEARLYRETVTFLSAALDAPDNCEDAFGDDAGSGLSSPLAKEDEDYGRLADIALTITASLG
ncbi:putative invertase inhibitor [Cocos nucifera]|uniref:Putative invertase inhibitor n=1 Tax=Cocos nucifera TaxID=13894 RepID=A0A8K0ILX2_COCNU|nr:putative invertase inhibitor [Cocos nucifera]